MKIIQDHFGKKRGRIGTTIIIRNPQTKTRSFTVHQADPETLYHEIIGFLKTR